MITYSSGNHAQGVARSARLLGAPAIVVMPSDAPDIKRERVAADGAEIVIVGTASDERQLVAEEMAATRGLSIIPPYDDDRIIAGQGTVGLEVVEDLPELAAILVPIGGGGLASGIAVAVKAMRPSARVIGVEPELAADARDSLARGEIVRWPADQVSRTIADGTRTQALGSRTFAHLRAHLDSIVTVSEAEIAAAVRLAAERSRLVVEPSGALSIAAMAFHGAEIGLDGLPRTRRRGGQRRQRRPGPLPRVPVGADPARRLTHLPLGLAALLGQAVGEAPLPDPDLGQFGIRASVGAGRIAGLGAHPADQDRQDRGQEDRVAGDPHDPAARR